MTVPEDMAERHNRQLARFAELALSLAEETHAAALAAEAPAEKARLVMTFTRLGRAMRQSIAWEARLVRERARGLRAEAADTADAAARDVARRRDQVKAEVERKIWSEVAPAEADQWLADLEERLETEALYDDFLAEDVDAQIARLSDELGLTGEPKHNYVPRAFRPRPAAYAGRSPIDYYAMLGGDDEEEEAEEAKAAAADAARDTPAPPPPPILFNGRLAPPMDLPSWLDDDTS